MTLQSAIQLASVAPTAVLTPAAGYYAIFNGDGTGGTTAGTFYKKDSAGTVTALIPVPYTDEQAQDAVGSILTDTATVDFTYDDAGNTISAIVIDASITNTKLANMAQATFKMRAAAAGTGAPIDGTATQAKTALAIANTDVSGLGTLSTQNGTFSGTHSGASSGTNTGDQTITASADATAPGSTSNLALTLATVNSNVGSFGDGSHVGAFTVNAKGLTTAASSVTITPAAIGAPAGSGTSSGTNTGDITLTTSGITANGNAATLVGQQLQLQPASASFAGNMTAAQFTKLTNLVTGSNGWYDVTQYGVVANSSGAAAANVTAINLLLGTTATAGSVIFFPAGTYFFNAAWNSGSALAKSFVFYGSYGQSNIAMTANIGGTWITTNATANQPTAFINLCFYSSGVSQTAGAVIEFGNSSQPQVLFCQFSGGGGTFQMFNGVSMVGTNSGNGGTIDGCNFGQCNGTNMVFSGGQGSTVVSNTLVAGQTVSGRSVAGIQCTTSAGVSGGAIQIDNCDIIGCNVNLLLNPVTGTTLASIYAVNSFFDQGLNQSVLITGAGTVLRCRFQACYFTLLAASSSAAACETATTGSSIHGGIEFDNCWILNTPAGGGSPIGFRLAAIQDIGIRNCQIAGFTTGVDVTPNASSNCALVIEGNSIGPVGGVGGNTTGVLLRAGTYARQLIVGNDMVGNTTAITDSSTVTTTANNNRLHMNNQGYNPKSVVAQPAIPATGVLVFNSTAVDCTVFLKLVAAATVVAVGGVTTGITALTAAGVAIPIKVAANQSIAITYASTAPTWVWVGS